MGFPQAVQKPFLSLTDPQKLQSTMRSAAGPYHEFGLVDLGPGADIRWLEVSAVDDVAHDGRPLRLLAGVGIAPV